MMLFVQVCSLSGRSRSATDVRFLSSSATRKPKDKELLKGIPKNVVDEKTGSSKPATLSTILTKKETREESWEIMKYMSKFVWPQNP